MGAVHVNSSFSSSESEDYFFYLPSPLVLPTGQSNSSSSELCLFNKKISKKSSATRQPQNRTSNNGPAIRRDA